LASPKYAAYEKELAQALSDTERLRSDFLRLLDEDAAAYSAKDMERSLSVPVEICRLCHKAIELCPMLCSKGNVLLVSDVGVAAALLDAAFTGARLNVDINLKALKDETRARALRQELDGYRHAISSIRKKTEVSIGKIIRG